MNEYLKSVKESWNNTANSEWYNSLRTEDRIAQISQNPQSCFHPTTFELISKYFTDLSGKHILVPSSGDNHAVFAFALLGAKVTSSDISERQLELASEISKKHSWNIEYICDDTMTLSKINDSKYDFVYTSNGTYTWITDLDSMHKNIFRVLKDYGIYITYDIHPFTRPFSGECGNPVVVKPYTDTVAHNHWRIQDLTNSAINAGFHFLQIEEMSPVDASFWYTYNELQTKANKELEQINDWKHNPMAAIPAWLSMCLEK